MSWDRRRSRRAADPDASSSAAVRPSAARRARAVAVAALVVSLSGCASALNLPDAETAQAERMQTNWRVLVVLALVIGVIVVGLIGFVVVRYRRRSDELPGQRQYNLPLEIVYTAIPIVVVGGIFFYTVFTQLDVNELSDDADLVVDVEGFQWQWQFTYPDSGVSVIGTPGNRPLLMLPAESRIRFEVTARDVIHSFYVPGFMFKRDAIPGRVNRFEVDTKEPSGVLGGFCAEFCGLQHDRMLFDVEIVSRAEFARWIDERSDRT